MNLPPLIFREHSIKSLKIENLPRQIFERRFPKKRGDDHKCYVISSQEDGNHRFEFSYYIGVDWISRDHDQPIYVAPKLNNHFDEHGNPDNNINEDDLVETDYLKMLFTALKHKDVAEHTDELFVIDFEERPIEIEQKQDLLTPILVVQFLLIVKAIVRKGLKKSYYKVEENLNSRIKGKVLVSRTIKQNIARNKHLNTFCSYDEFGLNTPENRLLKKALSFVQKYLPLLENIPQSSEFTKEAFNYIMPVFETVSEEINSNDLKHTKNNSLYKEYTEAIRLAKLILKRFGYNISNAGQMKTTTPPFWIDMSKLFELYVLGLLKDRFGKDVIYHIARSGNELDFLLNSPSFKMVIDAKYKPIYRSGFRNEDIRQLSGYARLKSVYNQLGKVNHNEVIDCLIIYPDQDKEEDLQKIDFMDKKYKLEEFVHFYTIGIKLPLIDKQ